jgi:hypothetical protein
VGGAIFRNKSIESGEEWHKYSPGVINNYFSLAIDGTGLNDIVITGFEGEVIHYNGNSWKNYTTEFSNPASYYRSVQLKDNLFVAVGRSGHKAAILIGRR